LDEPLRRRHSGRQPLPVAWRDARYRGEVVHDLSRVNQAFANELLLEVV
jgi:hypothetical protein